MPFTEHDLQTIASLVKKAAYKNAYNLAKLEDNHSDLVALQTAEIYQSRLTRKEQLEALACKIHNELVGIKVEA